MRSAMRQSSIRLGVARRTNDQRRNGAAPAPKWGDDPMADALCTNEAPDAMSTFTPRERHVVQASPTVDGEAGLR